MTVDELRNRLEQEEISNDFYSLCSYDCNDCVCLTQDGDAWSVYYFERGVKFDCVTHDNEDEACRDVLNRLIDFKKYY